MSALLEKVDVDEKSALTGLEKGYSLATDVAEYLVMKGVPFREAHLKVGRLTGWCIENKISFNDLTFSQWKEHIPEIDEGVMKILSPRDSVNRRNTYGGTGFSQVEKQIKIAQKKLHN